MDGLLQAGRLTLRPSGHGRGYSVEVTDAGGTTLATCAADGTIADPAGTPLLRAPLDWEGRRHKPTDAFVQVTDAEGSALGTARVVKYGVGPRAKKAAIEVTEAQGAPALRLEPSDKRGDQLTLTEGATQVATVGVEQVKAGLLRKARVYTVEFASSPSEPVRPLALATLIRYDALLNAVVSASARD